MMTTTNYSDLLHNLYYNPSNPSSYSSVKNLYNAAKNKNELIKLNDVKLWLSGETPYTLHKPARKNFPREHILVSSPGEQYQADLVDMQKFSHQNKGYKYILTIIDCFSRYAWAVPVKNKFGISIKEAIKNVIDKNPPFKFQTDRGKEFLNSLVQEYLKSIGVHYFNTYNTKFKCAIVERFNRTLKSRMFKYFTANGTRKYLDVLPKLVSSYNRTKHRAINTAPINVTEDNKDIVFENIYGFPDLRTYLLSKSKSPGLEIGDEVRMKYDLDPMDKGYYPTWTDVIYKIAETIKSKQRPMYKLLDEHGHLFKQRFYPEEVQKVNQPLYRIEKIIKRETRNGKQGFIVKWIGYSDPSWVEKEAIRNVRGTY